MRLLRVLKKGGCPQEKVSHCPKACRGIPHTCQMDSRCTFASEHAIRICIFFQMSLRLPPLDDEFLGDGAAGGGDADKVAALGQGADVEGGGIA